MGSSAGTTPDPNATPSVDFEDVWELGANPAARASLTAQLYRYTRVGHRDEVLVTRDHSYIPTGGSTWLTPNRYETAADAESYLALPNTPEHRIGPIWSLDVSFDGVSARLSPPRFGKHGGAWELTTTRRIPYGERHPLT